MQKLIRCDRILVEKSKDVSPKNTSGTENERKERCESHWARDRWIVKMNIPIASVSFRDRKLDAQDDCLLRQMPCGNEAAPKTAYCVAQSITRPHIIYRMTRSISCQLLMYYSDGGGVKGYHLRSGATYPPQLPAFSPAMGWPTRFPLKYLHPGWADLPLQPSLSQQWVTLMEKKFQNIPTKGRVGLCLTPRYTM
jgi:hypothetical protein